ncbi:MAG TPA: phage minor head protein [Thermodesulfobacteriota bacterium]|nr:phage minor head protein [Thermodesulfobacteriota bacterium]
MPKNVDLSFAFGLKPERAVDYMKSKGYTFSWRWEETLGAAHARAFTVAKVARMDVLQDIRGMVEKSLEDGLTFEQFKKQLEPGLRKKGWWGKQIAVNKKGVAEVVELGSPRRLRTIYNQNLMTAYSAGREEFFQANKEFRPYGMYVAVRDSKTRHTHLALHGKVYPLDDDFWKWFTPPIDWGCRCRKRAVSRRYVDKNNITVLSSRGQIGKTDALISTRTGELRQVTTVTLPGGQKVSTGIGFDYNPATAAWQPNLDSYDWDIAAKYVEGTLTGPAFQRFYALDVERGTFPVATLDPQTKSLLGAKTQHLKINKRYMGKQVTKHPEFVSSDYLKLQAYINNADLIVDQGKKGIVFVSEDKGLYYEVVVEFHKGKSSMAFRSLYEIRESQIQARREGGRVLKDKLKRK